MPYAEYIMSHNRATFLFSLASPTTFMWVIVRCEVERIGTDNVTTDVLSWSYLKYLLGENAFGKFQFLFLSTSNRHVFFWSDIDRCINSGLLGEWGALIVSACYQVQAANVTQSLCEIDWGDRSKQIPSADELSYSKMKRKSQKWE